MSGSCGNVHHSFFLSRVCRIADERGFNVFEQHDKRRLFIELVKPCAPDHARFSLLYFKENIDENYRICYKSFDDRKIRRFYFVGDHKEYER